MRALADAAVATCATVHFGDRVVGGEVFAPHRIVAADGFDGFDQGRRPFGLPDAIGTARARLGGLLPSVERRTLLAHGLRRLLGGQAVGHRPAPARHHVASYTGYPGRSREANSSLRPPASVLSAAGADARVSIEFLAALGRKLWYVAGVRRGAWARPGN